jgi:hypothetical protein
MTTATIMMMMMTSTTITAAYAQAQPPRPEQPQSSLLKLVGEPTVELTEPYNERGLATESTSQLGV